MDDRLETRKLENAWRERVNAAEELYRRARAEADAALESCDCDATSAQIETVRETRVRESAALDEYMRVLRIFHEWVAGGKGPGSSP
jgi:hypothetical protein